MKNEDIIPDAYKYSWSKDSELSLNDFLNKYKPSMVQNDGTKHWIWVRGNNPPTDQNETKTLEAIQEASTFLDTVTEKVEDIKNDDSIPVRSNKKTGAKSKKEVREQLQAEATAKLKEISVKHKYVNGKWLIFAPAERVDSIWSGIATSIIEGPLNSTSAYSAKVSTSPSYGTPNHQHIICVYLPDVYDKDKVTEVMKILLRNHGVNLSGVKSDLYTNIGLDSKHASGVPSTVWKNAAILTDKESKELKDAYFANLQKGTDPKPLQDEQPKPTVTSATVNVETSGQDEKAPKTKSKLKKKVADDPFGSDSEPETKKPAAKTKPTAKKPVKRAKKDSDSDEDEQPKRKKSVKG